VKQAYICSWLVEVGIYEGLVLCTLHHSIFMSVRQYATDHSISAQFSRLAPSNVGLCSNTQTTRHVPVH